MATTGCCPSRRPTTRPTRSGRLWVAVHDEPASEEEDGVFSCAPLAFAFVSAVHVCLASRGASEQCIGYRAAPRCRLVV
eukprot:scaffold19853_cov56-Phaeocystis_antarctica.AAC.3